MCHTDDHRSPDHEYGSADNHLDYVRSPDPALRNSGGTDRHLGTASGPGAGPGGAGDNTGAN
ncbi:hypothetical protein CH275_16690 [Rhodococcus sp. 06-235-1A]|uniref:hypothetical protein n=1 Tax=Rhodococcus sp. 06-235-1A TaxID=2022508 RepID=UPI000B9A2BA1|nr:hypothetical protein [Rhodococcus sp. 06-235-1A]OZD03408.1 hypothetical protein CH275_16690 [Rhodococcus sp. 06-235-1A]